MCAPTDFDGLGLIYCNTRYYVSENYRTLAASVVKLRSGLIAVTFGDLSAVFLTEFFDATCCINNFLFAGVKRMAN